MRHAKPYRLWQRGMFWYYRLADEGKWISTGKSAEHEAHAVAMAEIERRRQAAAAPQAPPAGTLPLREYASPFSSGVSAPTSGD